MPRDLDEPRRVALEFDVLCAQILIGAGYSIDRERRIEPEDDGSWRFDFVATRTSANGRRERRLVDVKWMALQEATLQVAQNIASLYTPVHHIPKGTRRTLILSAAIPAVRRRWVAGEFDTEIWGREALRRLAAGALVAELDSFVERSDRWREQIRTKPPVTIARPLAEMARMEAKLDAERADAFALAVSSDPNESGVSGHSLCRELKKIPHGKAGADAFEKITVRIFAFLFPGDLVRSGAATKRTEDGLNIYDLVFQIRTRSDFWTNLTRDLRSRVLIVECKNYVEPIRAMQIYTTERYLSPSAMRSIAIIVTRKAPHKSAVEAASGALRESGKLMLILDQNAICAMLHARDLQLSSEGRQIEENDPAEIINSRLHQFLARLPR